MNIIVSAKNFELTPSIKQYAEEKIGRLEKFWDQIIRLHVELSIDRGHKHGLTHLVHVWAEIPGHDISAESKSDSMQAAIDLTYPKMERQIVKAKERMSDRRA